MKESFLKMAMGMTAVTLLLGMSTFTVHAADKPGARANTPIHAVRSPAISGAWARATVPGQAVGAAYMKINSLTDAVLTDIESDVSQSTEVHSMTHQDGVMKMRKLNKLDIPAGKTIELTPGGNHLMLIGLKKPLKAGDSLQLKMTFVDSAGAQITVPLSVPIRSLGQ
jgi:copper(I)-binding protein